MGYLAENAVGYSENKLEQEKTFAKNITKKMGYLYIPLILDCAPWTIIKNLQKYTRPITINQDLPMVMTDINTIGEDIMSIINDLEHNDCVRKFCINKDININLSYYNNIIIDKTIPSFIPYANHTHKMKNRKLRKILCKLGYLKHGDIFISESELELFYQHKDT